MSYILYNIASQIVFFHFVIRRKGVKMYPYINYVTPYISSYAEKSLMISDAMGYIDDPDFIIDRNYFNNHLIM